MEGDGILWGAQTAGHLVVGRWGALVVVFPYVFFEEQWALTFIEDCMWRLGKDRDAFTLVIMYTVDSWHCLQHAVNAQLDAPRPIYF